MAPSFLTRLCFSVTLLIFGNTCFATTGTISSSPSHLVMEPQTLGTTTISWSISGASTAQVYVSNPGGQETLMVTGASGTVTAPWIQSGQAYVFRLYEGTSHTNLLAWTSVTSQAPPASRFGFNYWPAGHRNDTLLDANWSTLNPVVQADLDHLSSLGGGTIRVFFWPQTSGYLIDNGQGGRFTSDLAEITNNLPAFLKLCADRNIGVIIAFGNNYYSDSDPSSGLPWWAVAYGNSPSGFSAFLTDTATWMNKIIDAAESSPSANSIIYYDMENEYSKGTQNAQWYISFLYDWSHVPDGKRGNSVLNAADDGQDLATVLNTAAGPKLGSRHLDYIDFHSYVDAQSYPSYVSNSPSTSATTLRNLFPGATVLMGEFGYQAVYPTINGSTETLRQQTSALSIIDDAKAAGVSYYLNWELWDNSQSQLVTAFGATPNAPRDVLGGIASSVSLAANSDMETVVNGSPAHWSAGGTVPVTLSSQSGYGAGNSATNFYYARVGTQQTSGVVWLASDMMPVQGGERLFLNAYIRASMTGVSMGVAEFDENKNAIQSDSGPSYNPGPWGYVSYLQQISNTCSTMAAAQDQCSWSVVLQPNTAYVIITINGHPAATAPSYLDVDTVSAWQQP